jgi:hypothetical protein
LTDQEKAKRQEKARQARAFSPEAGGAMGLEVFQEDADPSFVATVLNVLLVLAPRICTAPMHTVIIRASITAYSTAVGPSSLL